MQELVKACRRFGRTPYLHIPYRIFIKFTLKLEAMRSFETSLNSAPYAAEGDVRARHFVGAKYQRSEDLLLTYSGVNGTCVRVVG